MGLAGIGRSSVLGLALMALGACADTAGTAPAASVPASCPATLAYVKDKLVTPYPELEAFIGKDALDATLSEPIDDMIARGGGIDASIQGGQNHVEEYQNTLKNKAALTAELRNDKMTDQWIDTYFLSVQDGITINQGFVDAVKCRQIRAQAQGSAAN
ncbi:MAG TPA: hypothetical protein VN821_12520 [Candidatus Udaeobacter sp.]|nr:hypothetical protein [Candidatus Udaeobacter sp.]